MRQHRIKKQKLVKAIVSHSGRKGNATLDKNDFLQFVSDAYEKNSAISFTFFGYGVSEEKATEEAGNFSKLIGGEIEKFSSDDEEFNWFMVSNGKIEASFFYDKEGGK